MTKLSPDTVEIVEPPIEELTKRPSVWKRACALGCGGVLIVLIAFFVIVKLAIGPGPSTLRTVPDNFPASIPLYDKDNIDLITFIPGRYKSRAFEIAAIFPKIILAPLFLSLQSNGSNSVSTAANSDGRSVLNRFWQVITTPVSDAHDTVQIEWRNIDADPQFVYNYYRNELKKKNYNIDSETIENHFRQFTFSNDSGVIGSLMVNDNTEIKPGTDYALLIVSLPPTVANTNIKIQN